MRAAGRKNSSNLFEAVQRNDEKFVKHFVEEKCVPVTTTNSLGMTAAHIAASNGNLTILKYLVEKDATLVGMKDRWQQTALLMAVGKGARDVVEYLVDTCSANIFQTSHVFHFNSVLHIAAEAGRLEVLKYFVEKKKMDANTMNSAGQPPAFLAASRDHVHIVEYLVEQANADVTLVDNQEKSILHIAAVNGCLRVPKFLLDQKKIPINIDHPDNLGRTALNLACSFAQTDFVKYMVEEKHADVNRIDNLGWSPLHQVVYAGNLELVRFLVEHKADPALKDSHGNTVSDLTTNANVTEYLKEVTIRTHNRTRRSYTESDKVSSSEWLNLEAYLLPVQINIIRNSIGRSDGLIDTNSFTFSNTHHDTVPLLMLANALPRLFSRSTKSTELPQRGIQNKIDSLTSLAVDSVFSEKFEN